jgi:hypothetical protein
MKRHMHNWSLWSIPFNSYEERPADGFGEMRRSDVVIQTRSCVVCNEWQSRTIRDGQIQDQAVLSEIPIGLMRDAIRALDTAISTASDDDVIHAENLLDAMLKILDTHPEQEVRNWLSGELKLIGVH